MSPSERYEVRCDRCGLVEVIEPADAPGEMAALVYAEFEAANHSADCLGTADIGAVPDVDAESTKYSVEGS